MSTLILKSKVAVSVSVDNYYKAYYKRVYADGGRIDNPAAVKAAMTFVLGAGIEPWQVKVATAASWGMKDVTGFPQKLYSLFNASGDLVMESQDANKARVDKGSYAFKTIKSLGGKLNNPYTVLKAEGTFDVLNTSVTAVVTKGFSDTGQIAAAGYVGLIWSDDVALTYRRYLEMQYTVPSTDPATWGLQVRSHRTQGKADLVAPQGSIWLTKAVLVESTAIYTLDKTGVLSSLTGLFPSYNPMTDLRFHALAPHDGAKGANPIRGNYAESWVVTEANAVFAQALAAHLDAKYPNL